jgi:hypothetical protein
MFMISAALRGLTGAGTLTEMREAGLGMRTQEFYRSWGAAREIAAGTGQEPTRPVGDVPAPAEISPIATNGPAGFLQTVTLVYKERVTGNRRVVYHSTKSDLPVTREQAINNAISAYEGHSEEYQTDLLGAFHTSTIQLVPVEVA